MEQRDLFSRLLQKDVELLEMMDHTNIPKLVRDLRDANEILDNLAIFSLEDLKLLHELQTQLLFEYYLMINELSRAVSSMRKELVFDMNALGSVESSRSFAEFQRIAARVHNLVRDLRDANEILDNLAIFSLEDLKLLHELQTQLLFEYYLMINELSRAVSSMRKELVFDINALGSVESSGSFAEFQRIAARVHNVKCRMDVVFEKLNSFVRRLKMGIDLETEFRRKTKSPVKFPLKVFYEFVTGQRNILELIITEAEWHTTHNTMYTLNGHAKSFAREIYWCVYLESSLEKARQEIYEESLKYK
ncbi:hypothetical protein O9G_005676 [Rozella allomycis CSF55]|uniref:Uncharacterized protein n=1 Tax=Rozella allomycis (strain CSF55) TaxID=988480 RepID=A0A075AY36_ROZAC|nr:hypothetical protein O9G_005676 [Rozella allomycis CSF55]|eukprot:EPZ35230.1 hypothetical protein O9G_005676 [Rozella allomycis CSF55]